MNGITALAGVQERIASIEQRVGVARGGWIVERPASAAGTDPAAFGTLLGSLDSSVGTSMPTMLSSTVAQRSDGLAVTSGVGGYDVCPDCAGRHRTDGELPAGTPFAELFASAAERHGIPAPVLAAIGHVESRFRTDVVSSAGALGVMQFLPATADAFGVDPYDPASAIDGAARYLRQMWNQFGSLDTAIAAYNVGPGTISRAGGVQPGTQAERYLQAVHRATEMFT